MSLQQDQRAIPRVWEVDWGIPAAEGGTLWESYNWLLTTAKNLGESDVSIVGATYNKLGRIEGAIGAKEANSLRVLPHQYVIDGITVHGVSRRGGWYTQGPVLVAWATDQVLTEVERQRPPAIAAVADWPDDIAGWRSVYRASRIGQERHEQEAKFNTKVIADLDPRMG